MPEVEAARPPRHAAQPAPAQAARPNLSQALLRPGRSQLVVALVLGLVGFSMVTQVQTRGGDQTYSSLRRADLVTMVEQLNAESARLRAEADELTRTKEQLASGVGAREVAAQENRKRLDALRILAGTVPATGPGIRIVIDDPAGQLGPEVLLNAVQEMRDAGAETMAINSTVRVVASTFFAKKADGLVVDGKQLVFPLVLDVIGDSHALDEAARFRGGLVSQVQSEQVGGTVTITEVNSLVISALHDPMTPQWARPA